MSSFREKTRPLYLKITQERKLKKMEKIRIRGKVYGGRLDVPGVVSGEFCRDVVSYLDRC